MVIAYKISVPTSLTVDVILTEFITLLLLFNDNPSQLQISSNST